MDLPSLSVRSVTCTKNFDGPVQGTNLIETLQTYRVCKKSLSGLKNHCKKLLFIFLAVSVCILIGVCKKFYSYVV